MLATGTRMYGGSMVYRWALTLRAWVTIAREGPAAALPTWAELATRTTGDAGSFIATRAALAANLADAGQRDEARAHLAALSDLIAPYRAGAADLDTPRSLLAGPSMHDVLIAALLLDEPRWIDVAEAEIRSAPMGENGRHYIAAARALQAGDAAACARSLEKAYQLVEHVGLAGTWNRFAVSCVRIASERGLRFGDDWAPIAARTRAFAEHAGAKWWLEVLGKAGL
jgi:hypothetical protein